jgi:hypothetical protein
VSDCRPDRRRSGRPWETRWGRLVHQRRMKSLTPKPPVP